MPGVLTLALVVRVAHPQGTVRLDSLHDPLLPVRHTQGGVVAAGLDQVTTSDTQPVTAGRCRGVVDEPTGDPLGADPVVDLCVVVVGCDRDPLACSHVGCEAFAQAVGVLLSP